MKYIFVILIFCSCTTTKSFVLDGSKSHGNIVKWEWKVNGSPIWGISTSIDTKKKTTIELIVTDNKGRRDTATATLK